MRQSDCAWPRVAMGCMCSLRQPRGAAGLRWAGRSACRRAAAAAAGRARGCTACGLRRAERALKGAHVVAQLLPHLRCRRVHGALWRDLHGCAAAPCVALRMAAGTRTRAARLPARCSYSAGSGAAQRGAGAATRTSAAASTRHCRGTGKQCAVVRRFEVIGTAQCVWRRRCQGPRWSQITEVAPSREKACGYAIRGAQVLITGDDIAVWTRPEPAVTWIVIVKAWRPHLCVGCTTNRHATRICTGSRPRALERQHRLSTALRTRQLRRRSTALRW